MICLIDPYQCTNHRYDTILNHTNVQTHSSVGCTNKLVPCRTDTYRPYRMVCHDIANIDMNATISKIVIKIYRNSLQKKKNVRITPSIHSNNDCLDTLMNTLFRTICTKHKLLLSTLLMVIFLHYKARTE